MSGTNVGITGSCFVSVNVAGHSSARTVEGSGELFRAMAHYIITKCVVQGGGVGGFITQGLTGLAQYVLAGGGTTSNPNNPNILFRKLLIHAECQGSRSLTNSLA